MRLLVSIALILLVGVTVAQQSRQLLHEGNQAYKQGNYEQAESLYRSALEKDRGDFIGNYNLGTALYRQGRYEEAVEQFVASYPLQDDPKLVAKACHNVGNSWLQQRKWKEAADAYKEALKNNPDDEKSRYNLAYAQAMMKKDPQQQQQQNKDQNKENQDKKDGKDKKENQNKDQGEDKNEKKDPDQDQQQSQGDQQQDKQKQQQKNQLSKAEAKRLLDASNNAERKTQAKVMVGKKQKKEKGKIEKDW